MSNLRDYRGVDIRLTDERLAHMRDVHPEIAANEQKGEILWRRE